MNPIRREVLNGLFVLVISTLLSAAIAAFEIKFNLQVWLLIVIGVAVAVSGYVVFKFVLSAEEREKEWLKRVGTPARLVFNREGPPVDLVAVADAVKAISPDSALTIMYYSGSEGGGESRSSEGMNSFLDNIYRSILEQVRRGTVREYKSIFCFDRDVLANDPELKSGVLRVGEGPGTIDRARADHCRVVMKTRGCSLYVAPAVLRMHVCLYGSDKVSITLETAEQDTGVRNIAGTMFFCDPPNGEIIEQIREMVRTSEKRMVAVHKILFPEDAEPTTVPATRRPTAR